jgi:transcriptional regulator with XRE-family HTH domain
VPRVRLRQEQLAHKAGMAIRYVAGVERGEENPSLGFLVKIADALGAEPATLLERQVRRSRWPGLPKL